MAANVLRKIENGSIEMRRALCDTMLELANENSSIVYLDADLFSSSGMGKFKEKYPERAFNVGIAEANMVGVACGMSVAGCIPFVHSFGPFASRRCYDQIFLSGGYNKANVKIIGSDPGITAAYNGGTHMPFEDVALMREIPGMIVVEPTDPVMLKNIVKQLASMYTMAYIRLKRKTTAAVYEEGSTFEIGKSVKLREGKDITLIASGIMVAEALKAAVMLEEEGKSARVLDMFTIKPIDQEAVISAARDTGAIVTCENHNIIGGLGSAVAEVISENYPAILRRVGVQDEFGEVGTEDYLRERFGLTAQEIFKTAKTLIYKK